MPKPSNTSAGERVLIVIQCHSEDDCGNEFHWNTDRPHRAIEEAQVRGWGKDRFGKRACPYHAQKKEE